MFLVKSACDVVPTCSNQTKKVHKIAIQIFDKRRKIQIKQNRSLEPIY